MSTSYAARKRPWSEHNDSDNSAGHEECALTVLLSYARRQSFIPATVSARSLHGLLYATSKCYSCFGLHCESERKTDVHYIVMERLPGGNLLEKVCREGQLPI